MEETSPSSRSIVKQSDYTQTRSMPQVISTVHRSLGRGLYQPSYPSKSIHPPHFRIECLHPPWIRQTIARHNSTRPDKTLCQGHQLPLTTLHSPVLSRNQEISRRTLQIYPRIRASRCIRRLMWQPFQRRCKRCHLMRSTLGWHFPATTLVVLGAPTPMPLLINHRGAESLVLVIIRQPLIPRRRPRVVKGRQRIEKTRRDLEVARRALTFA